MKISQINTTNFQGATIIKSKETKFINLLNDIDFDILKKTKNPQVRFNAPAGSSKTDGYWVGLLTYGKDTGRTYPNNAKLKEKEITSVNDIFNISQFKNIKQVIKDYCQKLSAQ